MDLVAGFSQSLNPLGHVAQNDRKGECFFFELWVQHYFLVENLQGIGPLEIDDVEQEPDKHGHRLDIRDVEGVRVDGMVITVDNGDFWPE